MSQNLLYRVIKALDLTKELCRWRVRKFSSNPEIIATLGRKDVEGV